jgi:hypothetical protein
MNLAEVVLRLTQAAQWRPVPTEYFARTAQGTRAYPQSRSEPRRAGTVLAMVCPSCGGWRENPAPKYHFITYAPSAFGHRQGCEMAALVAEATRLVNESSPELNR